MPLIQQPTLHETFDWKSNVSQTSVYSGWYAFLVRSRAESKVKTWLEMQFSRHSGPNRGLEAILIPSIRKNIVQDDQAPKETQNLWTVFAKAYDSNDIEQILGTIDYREKQRIGIRRAFAVKDIEVYKMMEGASTPVMNCKVGDTVIIKDAEDQIEYQVSDVSEDAANNETVACLVVYLFNQKITKKVPVQNLLHVNEKKRPV